MTREEEKFINDMQEAVGELNRLIKMALALGLEVEIETLHHCSLLDEDTNPLLSLKIKKQIYNGSPIL